MTECYCGDEPDFYRRSMPIARKPHHCTECSRVIKPGERYEYVAGKWEYVFDTYRTCRHCLALRDYVEAHIPCVCWSHGNMIDECIEVVRDWAHETDGLLFGTYRRQVLINRAKRVAA